MEWKAEARFARFSPRKVGQILDLIRGKSVSSAFKILNFVPKVSKELVIKTLKSAVANAGRLKKMDGLYISECWANKGPVMKRYRARAYGRAVVYRRKMCHLTIKVTDKH